MTSKNIETTRYFSKDMQQQFATLTGDWNPMHMDAIAARRTQPGAPVVHGIHTLLWALEWMAAEIPEFRLVRQIKVDFCKWVYVDTTASLIISASNSREIKARISVGGIVAAKITVVLGDVELAAKKFSPEYHSHTTSRDAKELQFEEMASQSGTVDVAAPPEELARLFPRLAGVVQPHRVAALGSLSRLVGMICPGLHSIFSGLNITFIDDEMHDALVHYRVKQAIERYRMVTLEIEGLGIAGHVDTFSRVAPALQASMDSVARYVGADEFSGTHALIVGGSRGLGELTAKVIAAGGGDVTITYAVGKEEAEGVAKEIQESGGRCGVIAFNALHPAAPQLRNLTKPVTHAYYYATGQIFRVKKGLYSPDIYREFTKFYVDSFVDLCQSLATDISKSISVFYPSSVAVTDRPADMTEYAMAKAAGEVLCEDINRYMPGVRVVVSRLPRLPTDQTLSVIPVRCSDPLEVILPIIRDVQGAETKS
ncbi:MULTISPECIES: SDR family NAD(P)-dependent oxidoreductase [Acidobacteriaceae]|uniref:SDR family NAD(P)-dependent oxidoreductase n=1 Tax=Acidobacteriaceae TaxID=204434 RepID=UPI00131E9EFC|nr:MULTISPECIES: SDR family NAD(P)-dependent oxidoreductase [Acidobacteriaceae]MDW5267496.1 SDR family NAD(P)-dependent oxidoreductase [Edaphobacter sp.]